MLIGSKLLAVTLAQCCVLLLWRQRGVLAAKVPNASIEANRDTEGWHSRATLRTRRTLKSRGRQ
jgi:hypothetical protein